MLRNILKFLSPAAFEQRERKRLRRALVVELEEIQRMIDYCEARYPVAIAQLERLQVEESHAALWAPATGAERWTCPPARQADTSPTWYKPDYLFAAAKQEALWTTKTN